MFATAVRGPASREEGADKGTIIMYKTRLYKGMKGVMWGKGASASGRSHPSVGRIGAIKAPEAPFPLNHISSFFFFIFPCVWRSDGW